jgi:hypothetical protein
MTAPDAATAVGFGDRPVAHQLRLVSWQPFRKGPLRGFATVELPIGLKIFDVSIWTVSNGLWAGLPAKWRKTDVNGTPVNAEVPRWRDRAAAERFSQAVVALVRQAHPNDLAD